MKKAKKLILIGIDSLMLKRIDKFRAEGLLPAIGKLMDEGITSLAYPELPTYTPTNWTTIATGTTPATHGIWGWVFDSRQCKAEQIWTAAERGGKKSIILRYPGGWPPTIKDGVVMETGVPNTSPWVMSYCKAYSTRPLRRVYGGMHGQRLTPVKLERPRPASGWKSLPESNRPPLESSMLIEPIKPGKPLEFYVLILASSSSGYDTVLITNERSGKSQLAQLRLGEWSNFIKVRLALDEGEEEGFFRVKLLELSPDADILTLYRSQVHSSRGFIYPEEVNKELIDLLGPYLDNPSRLPLALGWHDQYFDDLDYHVNWLCDAAEHLMSRYHWDLFFIQCHCPDYIEHECMGGIDPTSGRYKESEAKRWWDIYRRAYSKMDYMVGRLCAQADEDTLVALVSDHGHVMQNKQVLVLNALVNEGLAVVDESGNLVKSKSKVIPVHPIFLALNNEIVKPSDRRFLINKTIDVLYSIKDELSGVRPISLALKREEAGIIGLNSDKIPGEVIFEVEGGYGVNFHFYPDKGSELIVEPDPQFGVWGGAEGTHGEQLPSVDFSLGTIQAVFVLRGPGVKKGFRAKKPIFLRDVAPTLSHLLDIPMPKDAEGRILHEFFEN